MSIDADNFKALTQFATEAQRFCAFIESLQNGKPADLYRTLECLLARIYSAILPVRTEMPDTDRAELDQQDVPNQTWQQIGSAIAEATKWESNALFEQHAQSRKRSDSSYDDDTIRAGMLYGDLAELYADLKRGLNLWQLGDADAQAQAAWEWRYVYEIHWGNHLFRAMTTVHEARYQLYAD